MSKKFIDFPDFKWIASITCLLFSVGIGVWFALSLWSAFKAHNPQNLSCTKGGGVINNNFTYVQLDVLDQHPTEPYFNGSLFVNLNNAYGKSPVRVTFTLSASQVYAQSIENVDLHYDEVAQTLWPTKAPNISLNRLSGTHRDFPFDSAKFDFDLSYDPAVPVNNFIIRNHNPSFDLACDTYNVERRSANKVHIAFEVKRNPLVKLTAIILMSAGLLFLIGIVLFVKRESLPTSIASFFFSLWSIRAILSSEIKTFPNDP